MTVQPPMSSSKKMRPGVSVYARNLSYSVCPSSFLAFCMAKKCRKSSVTSCSSARDPTIHILRGINMYAESGELLAVMGASGSGKTTLLNVLADRVKKGGQLVGEIGFHGPPPGNHVSTFSNYVMQKDIQLELLTVEETLQFAAAFKLKNWSKAQRNKKVTAMLQDFKLMHCRQTVIGGDSKKGISGGQLKRVCIAVELLDDPSLLFLDEPTTGLDSALAFDVVKMLRQVASAGRTVICTIHQPRSQVVRLFDKMLLLSEGRVVYHGPVMGISSYFGCAGYPCPKDLNPTDFILDLLSPKAETEKEGGKVMAEGVWVEKTSQQSSNDMPKDEGPVQKNDDLERKGEDDQEEGNETKLPRRQEALDDKPLATGSGIDTENLWDRINRRYLSIAELRELPVIFQRSQEYRQNIDYIEKLLKTEQEDAGFKIDRKTTTFNPRTYFDLRHWLRSCQLIALRTSINTIRNPFTTIISVILNVVIGVFFGGLWVNIGDTSNTPLPVEESQVQARAFNIAGLLFFLTINIPFNSFQSLSAFQTERSLSNRETSAQLYPSSAFFIGTTLAGFPFQVIIPLVFLIIAYLMAYLPRTPTQIFIFLAAGVTNSFASNSLTYCIGALFPNIESANLFGPIAIVVLMLVSGGVFLKETALPSWVSWVRYFSWLRYSYFAIICNQFPTGERFMDFSNDTILEDWLQVKETRIWLHFVLSIVVGVVLRICAFFCYKYFNKRKGIE